MRLAKTWRFFSFALITALFFLALVILRRELSGYHWSDIEKTMDALRWSQIIAATLLTFLSYSGLTLYDVLALRYLKKSLPYRQTALASFLGYVFSYNIGLSIFGGGTVRYRLYSLWGLSPLDIGKLIGFSALTFWLGLLSLTGTIFVLYPLPLPSLVHWSTKSTLPLGIGLLLALSFYLGASLRGEREFRWRTFEFTLPSLKTSAQQICLGMSDLVTAGAVLYMLLPDTGTPSFPIFMSIYTLAIFLGMVSHVPGGVGIFEGVILVFLSSQVPGSEILSSLVMYRLLYYLVPFVLGLSLYAIFELRMQREGLKRIAGYTAQLVSLLTPRILAAAAFASGSLLLLSGATPSLPERLNWLQASVPLSFVEAAHFLGSLVGIFLLVLSRGILRKLDAAYHLTIFALAAGVILSLLKGLDYEEASILVFFLLAFLPSRRNFYRKAALFADRFSLEWILFVAMILTASVWLGFFAYQHVEYSHELWWTFAFDKDAPRFLRASIGASGLLMVFGMVGLLRPARPVESRPHLEDLNRVEPLAKGSERTLAQLALVGDKPLMFSEKSSAFLMYGIHGRSWVVLGGPFGDPKASSDLLWDFHELCDEHNGWEVYYQVHPHMLPQLAEAGFSFIKLGEEAVLDLPSFGLEGNSRKSLRQSQGRLQKQGLHFALCPRSNVPTLMSQLKAISDAWLMTKKTGEKSFSLGYFSEAYLLRNDLALVYQDEKLLGFANIFAADNREELSIDLMRYLPEAPPGLMDFLFCQLMLWGKSQGYKQFNLGMAPLSGMDKNPSGPFWNRFADFLYQHGEHFYNFQGLRTYKEKFHPSWEPRYLAYSSDASLPVVLTQVAALVGGGMKGIISR